MNQKEFVAFTSQLARMIQESEVAAENNFPFAIAKMNEMYGLPINDEPTIHPDDLGEQPVKRMQGFAKTLQKEMEEGRDIVAMMQHREAVEDYVDATTESEEIEATFLALQRDWKWVTDADQEPILDLEEIDKLILVALADWFGDMVVYIRSEAMKFGIPLEAVQLLIMASNFTKLNPDGSVIKDANGKVQKGPNFRPPEEALKALLFGRDALMESHIKQEAEIEMARALAVPALLTDSVPEEFYGDQYDEDEDDEAEDGSFALEA